MILKGLKFGLEVNCASRSVLFAAVSDAWARGHGFALATVNLDHIVKLERDGAFREAYASQDLVVADGNPIVWISRLAGTPVELIPGSELVEPLAVMAAQTGVRVALVGSSDASLAGACMALQRTAPGLEVVRKIAPPYGFDPVGDTARTILKDIDESGAGLVFVALGAPKQEMFTALGRQLAPRAGFTSIGAGLDFLSGHQKRAPRWVRVLALEWLWRMLSNPGRMAKRYFLCAMVLPGLALRSR